MATYYVCPECGKEFDADFDNCDYCDNCGHDLCGTWGRPYCGDCDTKCKWNKNEGGWYCPNCGDYPDDVYFRDWKP